MKRVAVLLLGAVLLCSCSKQHLEGTPGTTTTTKQTTTTTTAKQSTQPTVAIKRLPGAPKTHAYTVTNCTDLARAVCTAYPPTVKKVAACQHKVDSTESVTTGTFTADKWRLLYYTCMTKS